LLGREPAGDPAYSFKGTIDELKLSNVVRTPDEIAESYRMGRDHYLSRALSSSQDLSTNTKMPFWIAADRPGAYLNATIGESAFANYQPDANTVGLWHLNEANNVIDAGWVKDNSGNGNNGTLGGGTLSAVPKSIQVQLGKGRLFDDVDDYIEMTGSNSLDLSTNGTIEAWVKPNADEANNWFICKNGNYCLGIDAAGQFLFTGGSAQGDNDTKLKAGNWYHVVVTNNNTTATYYINGVQTGTDTVAWGSTLTSTLRLGRDGGANYFDGVIDEVRISNVVRSASDIRQAYEYGRRTHPIVIDFGAQLDSGNLITGSGDTSFTVDATKLGFSNKGDNLFLGDKIIVKENYDGTEYISQGNVNAINQSTGAVVVSSWDSGSTFPSGGQTGFSANATVFKWQQEWFDVRGSLASDRDAINRIDIRVTDGNEGRTIWLDDIKKSGSYLTDPAAINNITSTKHQYIQYRGIFSTFDTAMTPYLNSVTLDYDTGPTLDQLMRHGKYFSGGSEQSFWWAKP
jgi:hypothetical protein